MGAVLGVAAQADHLAQTLDTAGIERLIGDGPPSSDEDAPCQAPLSPGAAAAAAAPRRGGYGAMKKAGPKVGGENAAVRVASWSDTGGLREATFVKKNRNTKSAAASVFD